jgi:hypothetical protein
MFESPTLNISALATRVPRSRVDRLRWSSRLFMQAAASKMRASNSSGVSTFLVQTSLNIQPHKQKSVGVRSGDSNSSISVTSQN